MSDEQKSSCKHCMRYPRVLNVVQDSREHMPLSPTPAEVKNQLKALYKKLPVEYMPDEVTPYAPQRSASRAASPFLPQFRKQPPSRCRPGVD